jgi:hypothetical protein
MIRFLKDLTVPIYKEWRCGDGCCSGWELDGEDFFYTGEETYEESVEISHLEEGVDFEYV